jgi:hypothetical protein
LVKHSKQADVTRKDVDAFHIHQTLIFWDLQKEEFSVYLLSLLQKIKLP